MSEITATQPLTADPPDAITTTSSPDGRVQKNMKPRKARTTDTTRIELIASLIRTRRLPLEEIVSLTPTALAPMIDETTRPLAVKIFNNSRKRASMTSSGLAFPGRGGKAMKPAGLRLALRNFLRASGGSLSDLGISTRRRTVRNGVDGPVIDPAADLEVVRASFAQFVTPVAKIESPEVSLL